MSGASLDPGDSRTLGTATVKDNGPEVARDVTVANVTPNVVMKEVLLMIPEPPSLPHIYTHTHTSHGNST